MAFDLFDEIGKQKGSARPARILSMPMQLEHPGGGRRSIRTRPLTALEPLARGREIAARVKAALAAAGMPRTSGLAGGGTTGWTRTYGSMGFALRPVFYDPTTNRFAKPGTHPAVEIDVVISGKAAGLPYEQWSEERELEDWITLHEPIGPERLESKIRAALEDLGFEVLHLRFTGAQMHWDDDVSYTAIVAWVPWMGLPPQGVKHSLWNPEQGSKRRGHP